MSITTSLEHLADDIMAAYNAIDGKGGTIPEHKNTENLGDSIASIPSGGDDDPGDYGIVWYYGDEAISADVEDISATNCSAEITDETVFAKAILNSQMGGSAFSNFNLDISYQQGEGWMSWELSETPMTTEELGTQLGITVTDFDPETADFASIMIMGKLSIDKTQKPVKLKLQSLGDYERLADSSDPIVPFALVYKFMFGRAVTEVPDGFLSNVTSLEYLDTTYADGIITIGNSCISSEQNGVGIRNDIEFKNATSMGNYCFREGVCKGAMSFPNVVSVGNQCFTRATSQPSLPKVETIGNGFMTGCKIQDTFSLNQMPALRSIGTNAFYQGYLDGLYLDIRSEMQNLTSIGTGFCAGMYRLDTVSLSDGVELLNIDNSSFTVWSQSVSYVAGMKLNWIPAVSSRKQQFINAHPDITSGTIRRKWRS